MASKLSLFLAELKRRKVTRVAVVYALVGLGVIEGASMILPTLQLEAGYPYIVIFVLFGFPIALVLAWALEVTPQGIQRTPDLTPDQLASQTHRRSGARAIGFSEGLESSWWEWSATSCSPVIPKPDYPNRS